MAVFKNSFSYSKMNILETIIAQKRTEVEARKKEVSIAELEGKPQFKNAPLSLKAFIRDQSKTGIIAEYKRQSPSKGIINNTATVGEVTTAYAQWGASGISVLTDSSFFGGSLQDLEKATINKVPLLRKDFTIDAYQLVEAKAYGASVILLIAACLTPAEVKSLARSAKALGLEVLLELHDEEELNHICPEVDLVGINNRNLKTFTVDLEQSVKLAQQIDNSFIKVAESGISSVDNIHYLKQKGFEAFLIGENFMKETDPGAAFKAFAESLTAIK
jgi:indole-3-glycerol phosphate synthase